MDAQARSDAALPLFDLPHVEARKLLASGAPVYLTINPVEYHGPHLSLHNDRLISLGLARALHTRIGPPRAWPMLLAADLEIGVEPTHGIGTRRTAYPLVRKLVVETVRALAELGASKVIFMTFHGAPLHNLAIHAGVRFLEARGIHAVSPFNLVLHEMLALDSARYAPAFDHVADPDERAALLRDLPLDFHAGMFETSLALHLAPESVSSIYLELPPCPPVRPDRAMTLASRLTSGLGAARLSRELAFAAAGIGWARLSPFPGYTGSPHRASAQAGAFFAERISSVYAAHVDEVFAGRARPCPPIMAWAGRVSLGGRIGSLPRPPVLDLSAAPARG